jgi:putative SOS response-associated peptidase YedK
LRSCTIITTTPNEPMAGIHDRMPVILPRDAWDVWLDREEHDLDLLGRLLVPAAPEVIRLRPVSTEVNNVRNDGPQLTDEVDPDAPPEGGLGL